MYKTNLQVLVNAVFYISGNIVKRFIRKILDRRKTSVRRYKQRLRKSIYINFDRNKNNSTLNVCFMIF